MTIGRIIHFFKPRKWVVRRCGFPYPNGYGTFNRFRRMILDTGLSKQEARKACKELNKYRV